MVTRSSWDFVQRYWPVAIGLVGALWTAGVFFLRDAPLLATRVDGTAALTWSGSSFPDMCNAFFTVSFKNTGTSSLFVAKVRVRAWLLDESNFTSKIEKYLDSARLLDTTQPLSDTIYPSSTEAEPSTVPAPLLGRYFAGMQYHQMFEWNINRGGPRRFYVLVELFPNASDTRTDWYFTAWSPTCDIPSLSPQHEAAPNPAFLGKPCDKAALSP
jgi:hypothetical protein